MREMTEGQARFWTTLFGGMTAVGLIAGGFFAVVQYLSEREAANTTAAIQASTAQFDAKRPFYTKQLDLCESASGQAAILAAPNGHSRDDLTRARREFWRLYWGPLGIVEDSAVEGAMVKFGQCLEREGCSGLKGASLELAHACRELISKSWVLNLPRVDSKDKNLPPAAGQ